MRFLRIHVVAAAMLCAGLAACTTTNGDQVSLSGDSSASLALADPAEALSGQAGDQRLLGNNPNDDVSLGKKYFREGQFGVAETHFQRAVEANPRSAEGWLGLAASYDRLRRFDLADRAYEQTIRIAGATTEVLNNQGYSYMLRGDYGAARGKFDAALRQAPNNPYVKANLKLLAESVQTKQPVQQN